MALPNFIPDFSRVYSYILDSDQIILTYYRLGLALVKCVMNGSIASDKSNLYWWLVTIKVGYLTGMIIALQQSHKHKKLLGKYDGQKTLDQNNLS